MPIDIGKVFSTVPLRVTVSWCVASSAVATSVSPVWKLDTVPPASTVTAVWAGQKLNGRQRSCVGVIQ